MSHSLWWWLQQSSQGRISEELINRLMSILGHLVQLKTLKVTEKMMSLLIARFLSRKYLLQVAQNSFNLFAFIAMADISLTVIDYMSA